jgi:DNA (cytosine-5)-methyltransferase 1
MSLHRNTEIDGPAFRALREGAGLSRSAVAEAVGYSVRQIARWESGVSEPRRAAVQYLLRFQPQQNSWPVDFTFIDLFAGIGGFRLGFEKVGGRCVFTSEWDRFAQQTYKANFGDEHLFGDITTLDTSDVPDHDVLLAGFPCQPFSIAGVSKKNALGRKHGFDCDTQGTLFFDIERIIAAKQPRAFVLENVRNLMSHDRGRTFSVIRQTLEDKLGYRIRWKVLDAKGVLPQHRERIFIVGFHPDEEVSFEFDQVDLPDSADGPRLRTILHPEDGSEEPTPYTDSEGRVLSKYVLSDHLWRYLRDYARKHAAKGNGFGYGLVGPDDVARTLSARYYKDGSEILIRRAEGPPRRLTPRECARLMGFDEPARTPFRIVVSDTQAYRQFGNAVAVPVVAAVARAVANQLVTREARLAVR